MDVTTVGKKYSALSGALTERSRRLWAATEAMSLGHGGIALVERATGISRSTITRGIREVESGVSDELPPERTRRPGGVGVKITDEQMAKVRLEPHAFHGDWNYTIQPTRPRSY